MRVPLLRLWQCGIFIHVSVIDARAGGPGGDKRIAGSNIEGSAPTHYACGSVGNLFMCLLLMHELLVLVAINVSLAVILKTALLLIMSAEKCDQFHSCGSVGYLFINLLLIHGLVFLVVISV